MAAASAFSAPATPTIVSQFQPESPLPLSAGKESQTPISFIVRGLAYDGTPEPATIAPYPVRENVSDRLMGTEPPAPQEAGGGTSVSKSGAAPTIAGAAAPADIPALICSYTGWDCATALRVATCESGLEPWAENGRFKGLFQLDTYNGGWFAHFGYDAADWADPAVNVQVAYLLYASSGFSPWQCY